MRRARTGARAAAPAVARPPQAQEEIAADSSGGAGAERLTHLKLFGNLPREYAPASERLPDGPAQRAPRARRPGSVRKSQSIGGRPMYTRILMAYNGTREGKTALLACTEIAAFERAETHLLAVASMPSSMFLTEGFLPEELIEEEK
jgi:hypothetical protein